MNGRTRREDWRLDPAEIAELVAGTHSDPFSRLGMHPAGDGWVARAVVPGAERVRAADHDEPAALVDVAGERGEVLGQPVRLGVEVLQVIPATLYMAFEPSLTKTVPVMPEVEGDPAPGYEIAVRSAEPATVEIIGPRTAVAALTAAITEPVSVAGESQAVVRTVSVGVSDPTVRLKSVDVVRVTVTLRAVRNRTR